MMWRGFKEPKHRNTSNDQKQLKTSSGKACISAFSEHLSSIYVDMFSSFFLSFSLQVGFSASIYLLQCPSQIDYFQIIIPYPWRDGLWVLYRSQVPHQPNQLLSRREDHIINREMLRAHSLNQGSPRKEMAFWAGLSHSNYPQREQMN